jgi:selenide, water dikinase
MHPPAPIATDIVLLGAGHAHVEVLRRFAMRPEPGVRLTLIGREPETPYSGMLPGLIRRDYRSEQAHIDLAPLAAASGARLLMAEANRIDLAARAVGVEGRPEIPFDLLSVDVGGLPAMPDGAGIPVKPIGRFLARLEELERHLDAGARIAVVGAGPAGTELALALARRFTGSIRVTLVCSEADPIPLAPARARIVARSALVEAGVEIVSHVAALAYEHGRLALSDGTFLEAEEALWATPVIAPDFLVASGLACDEAGCIRVDRSLRSLSHPFVFAAGDCATVEDAPRPKAGVWAVRAGKPLAANLRRAAIGRRLVRWRPQREALVMLGLGDGRALAWRNGIAVSGEWVWRWKDHIDRHWMRMYQEMKPMAEDPAQPMRCGGCGAKVGAEVLEGALAALTRTPSPDILLGLDHPDDAAVVRAPAGMVLVQSVDHFRAFLDDPYVFGQIAAAHALSDLHAMGARPWTALAIASVPPMPGGKMRADLAAMLRGATEVLEADGCALVGGHSGESAEAALGFAVTGLADPRRVMRKSGLRAGDALVLTKPLGTGIILAANMRGRCKAGWLDAALDSMRRTNASAARMVLAHGAHACTDVTGFGLAGHLIEMLRASGVAAQLDTDTIPALPGARELAAEGIASTLAPDNSRGLQSAGITASPEWTLLVDPQTSGGLLAGIAPSRARECVADLQNAGVRAVTIGTIVPDQADAPLLRTADQCV